MPEAGNSRRRSRVRLALVLFVVLLVAFVAPPFISLDLLHLDRLSQRIVASLSRSLGRTVTTGKISFRLLPRPGFDVNNFAVKDDPHFSAEPVLRADAVRASLRLTSLWRGRLEIASLSLDSASLNLVRSDDGSWNLERLLLQAAQTPSAPTAKIQAEARPRFPYIEANDGRINFKSGPEKRVFAFSEADFALWLASENRWNVRLEARPIRTDENLADTGTISLSGSFDRASNIAATPFHFKLTIDKAQLGQWTRLIHGQDLGWRAGVHLDSEIQGTPSEFSAATQLSLSSFRRFDIARADNLDVTLRCNNTYRRPAGSSSARLIDVKCALPLGGGEVDAQGQLQEISRHVSTDLRISVNQVPVSALAFVLLHAKSTLPNDLSGDGTVNGDFSVTRSAEDDARFKWKGTVRAENATVRSKLLRPELSLGSFDFVLGSSIEPGDIRAARSVRLRTSSLLIEDNRAQIKSFAVELGGKSPGHVSGKLSSDGYEFALQGPAEIQRLLQIARTVGLNTPTTDAKGIANVDVQISGGWRNFAPPQLHGRADLLNASLSLKGIAEPLTITTARLQLTPDRVQLERIDAGFPVARLKFAGSLTAERHCTEHLVCNVDFALQTQELTSDSIRRLLPSRQGGLSFLMGRQARPEWLLALNASGTVSAAHLQLQGLEARNVSGSIILEPDKVRIKEVRGDVFGGRHSGDWTIQFSSGKPAYSGSGRLQHVNMQLLSNALKEGWGSGTLDAQYNLDMSGNDSGELLDSASGTANFQWQKGKLAGKKSATMIVFSQWDGDAVLRDRQLRLEGNRVLSTSGTQRVSGTVGLNGDADLQFEDSHGGGFAIQGPLNSLTLSQSYSNAALGTAHQ
jgi:hypothetical protein